MNIIKLKAARINKASLECSSSTGAEGLKNGLIGFFNVGMWLSDWGGFTSAIFILSVIKEITYKSVDYKIYKYKLQKPNKIRMQITITLL